jgi:NADPH2:quinone reductase
MKQSMISAVAIEPATAARFVIREFSAPIAQPNQAIIRVKAISLNRGEVRMALKATAPRRIGWDFAGIVEEAAADGTGPKIGSRVVGMLNTGAWSQLVAAPVNAIAELPPNVSFEQAATLPVAGLTALHALYKGGFLLGKSVLITGATGGTGDFACQLARLGGANVVATVRSPDRVEFVRELGVQHVIAGDDPSDAAKFGPYSLIIDSVGGPHFGKIIAMLASRGTCVIFGATGGMDTQFNSSIFYSTGSTTVYGLILFQELLYEPASVGLKILGDLVAAGQVVPHIDLVESWHKVAEITQQLVDRRYTGKAVLLVD